MRKNFGAKPILYPQPVFIIGSYDEKGVADAMNAAWGAISEANEISMCMSPCIKRLKMFLNEKLLPSVWPRWILWFLVTMWGWFPATM